MADEIVPATQQDGPESSFEAVGHDNGQRYWWESDVRSLLGYSADDKHWAKAVGRAIAACTALGIPVPENFQHVHRDDLDEDPVADCKLSRFACYLIAMNGDPRKPEVATAQAYFASFAEAAQRVATHLDGLERVVIRDEMVDREKSLSSVAKGAGVRDYALFQNAGYRGLYNMNLSQLKAIKGVQDGRTLLDFMGKEELAANLFRITQTESKIRKDNVRGQYNLENTAESVGRHVRKTIAEIGGTMPERLPPAQDLNKVKSGLKETHRELKKIKDAEARVIAVYVEQLSLEGNVLYRWPVWTADPTITAIDNAPHPEGVELAEPSIQLVEDEELEAEENKKDNDKQEGA